MLWFPLLWPQWLTGRKTPTYSALSCNVGASEMSIIKDISQHTQKVPHHFIFSACRSCGRQYHGCRNYITLSSMCAGPAVGSNALWWAVSWMLHLGSPLPGTHKGLALSFRPSASYTLLLYMLCLLPGILLSHITPPTHTQSDQWWIGI